MCYTLYIGGVYMKIILKIVFFPFKYIFKLMAFPLGLVVGLFHSVLFKNNKF